MNLSKNFTLEELTRTNLTLPNIPSESEKAKLAELVNGLLQPLRDKWGKPINVTSGFRSSAVNKEQGGSIKPLSQHCKGEAADLETDDNAHLFHLICEHFDFDQLIWESGNDLQPDWVHVSYKTKGNRKQVLRMTVVKGKKRYTVIS